MKDDIKMHNRDWITVEEQVDEGIEMRWKI